MEVLSILGYNWGYIGILEKKMKTTKAYWGSFSYIAVILNLRMLGRQAHETPDELALKCHKLGVPIPCLSP